ncbi:hypothetical protein Taro_052975 [Colocasia esculenta]|uniref:Uncharacterized protein n=1 Tax=Colocasia esculenta TaxID=4460 RepID=A0A843XL84_COLES|nr:hypothetical protein [Colocasia esculenta]
MLRLLGVLACQSKHSSWGSRPSRYCSISPSCLQAALRASSSVRWSNATSLVRSDGLSPITNFLVFLRSSSTICGEERGGEGSSGFRFKGRPLSHSQGDMTALIAVGDSPPMAELSCFKGFWLCCACKPEK